MSSGGSGETRPSRKTEPGGSYAEHGGVGRDFMGLPRDVYSNEPKEGFSRVPEPRFETGQPAANRPAPAPPQVQPEPSRTQPAQSTNAELCALYAEYLQLTRKSPGAISATSRKT